MDNQAVSVLMDTVRRMPHLPIFAATPLALMLLWSQVSAAKLNGLPSFEDASADFTSKQPTKIADILCPAFSAEVTAALQRLQPSEIEHLRRAVVVALDNQSKEEFAEAILQVCVPDAWIQASTSNLLQRALDAIENSSVYCSFSYAVRPAWSLSTCCDVDLDVESPELMRILTLLASACRRRLTVRANTLTSVTSEVRTLKPAHALIFPPIGMRLSPAYSSPLALDVGGPGPISSEALGAIWGAQLGRGRAIVVVGNGFLFRTSSKDAAIKQRLVNNYGLEAVVALPRGTFPTSAIAASALVFGGETYSKFRKDHLRFIDATNADTVEVAQLIDAAAPRGRYRDASIGEVEAGDFNLLVDRYILDPDTIRNRDFIETQTTAALSDLAEIRRSQALPRKSGNEEGVRVREALLADIDHARLFLPEKLSEIPRAAFSKIEASILQPGDILLSIKGTIGKTALVTDAPIAQSKPLPIVPGQSFVIIRLRKGGPIREPAVLATYLRTPIAQSLLERMAGGTTISNVAMGQLKNMPVIIPSAETQAKLIARFEEWEEIQFEMDRQRELMSFVEGELFALATGRGGREAGTC